MAVLLALSAFFSGSETALFSIRPDMRGRILRQRRTRVARLVAAEPGDLLSSILLGNLAVNILYFCTGAAWASQAAASRSGWIEALAGTAILLSVIALGELAPKAIGVNQPERFLRTVSLPLWCWFRVTSPACRILQRLLSAWHLQTPVAESTLNASELRELIRAIQDEPGFGTREKQLLEGLVVLPDVRVREIMVPRVQVARCPVQADRERLLAEALKYRARYIVIYRDREDEPVGYIGLHEVLAQGEGQEPLSSTPMRQPLFVPETMRADELIRRMLEEKSGFVAVVDEYGGLAGTVSLDRIPPVLFDAPAAGRERIEQIDESTFRLDGGLPVRAWRDLFQGFLPGPEIEAMAFETLGGLIASLLGRMPRAGDRVAIRNLLLTVESVEQRRIGRVLLHLSTGEEAS